MKYHNCLNVHLTNNLLNKSLELIPFVFIELFILSLIVDGVIDWAVWQYLYLWLVEIIKFR